MSSTLDSLYAELDARQIPHSATIYYFRNYILQGLTRDALVHIFDRYWEELTGHGWTGSDDDWRIFVKRILPSHSSLTNAVKPYIKEGHGYWPLMMAHHMLMSAMPLDAQGRKDARFSRVKCLYDSDEYLARCRSESEARECFEATVEIIRVFPVCRPHLEAARQVTDFSPDMTADSGNKEYQEFKKRGNDEFKKGNLASARRWYAKGLALEDLAPDSRAVLCSNILASCCMKTDRQIAKKAHLELVRYAPCWFKRIYWSMRLFNSLGDYDSVLRLAPFFPTAFPPDWIQRAQDELQIALNATHSSTRSHSLTFKTPHDYAQSRKSALQLGLFTWTRPRTTLKLDPHPPLSSARQYEVSQDAIFLALDNLYLYEANFTDTCSVVARAIARARGLSQLQGVSVVAESFSSSTRPDLDKCVIMIYYVIDLTARHLSRLQMPIHRPESFQRVLQAASGANQSYEYKNWLCESMAIMSATEERYEISLKAINQAIEADPGDFMHRYYKGVWTWLAHLQKHKMTLTPPKSTLPVHQRVPVDAIDNLLSFIETAPSDHPFLPNAHYYLAHMYWMEEQADSARDFFVAGHTVKKHVLPYLSVPDCPVRAELAPYMA